MLVPHPQKPSTTKFLLSILPMECYSTKQGCRGDDWGGKDLEGIGEWFQQKQMPTYCAALLGSEQIQANLRRRTNRSPPSPARAVVLKGQRLACVWIRSFCERGASERGRSGSCLPAPARAPSHRDGLPHHLSSGTTCCFSCMATTTAWDKGFKKWEGFWPHQKQ